MRFRLAFVLVFLSCISVFVSAACRQQGDAEMRDEQDVELQEESIDTLFADGEYGLATHQDTYDVHLIRYQNGKFFKRLILNEEIFDLYSFNWDAVRTIEAESLIAIQSSSVVMDQSGTLYHLYSYRDADRGVKQLITLTVDELVECGFHEDSLFYVSDQELDEKFYSTMGSVADSCDDLP